MNSNNNNNNSAPLPYGWVQQHDQSSGHTFFVDTKSDPPRSIWTHPYQDEQYLAHHPDVREKVGASSKPITSSEKPPSYNTSSDDERGFGKDGQGKKKKKGLLGALKEARVEHKARKQEQAQIMQQMNQERMANMQHMQGGRGQYAAPMSMYPGGGGGGGMMGMGGGGMSGMGGGRMGMGGGGMMPMGGGMMGRQRRRGGGMGGMALPLVGGLAGGMLLGDMMDNDNDYGGGGGDYGGGGDFGGGDFGGGDF